MLARDASYRCRLEGESGQGLWVLEHGREQKLDRHLDAELHMSCCDHDSHAADAKNAFDLLLARKYVALADAWI